MVFFSCFAAGGDVSFAFICKCFFTCSMAQFSAPQDISEVHPSIKGGDIWPKMRTMKQQDWSRDNPGILTVDLMTYIYICGLCKFQGIRRIVSNSGRSNSTDFVSQDLYDMSAYILYQNQTIPEKWGGGKVYY